MAQERIQKLLSRAGLASRREAETWIAEGRVSRNGVACQLGDRADPKEDRLTVDGRLVEVTGPGEDRVVLALHKPFGYVTTLKDPEGRRTVRDLLPREERLLPIGRLDLATEGLLLLTNDGDLLQAVAHPSGGVRKIYRAWVNTRPEPKDVERLLRGIDLEDGPARALSCRVLEPTAGEAGLVLDPRRTPRDAVAVCELTMTEGRRREVRRLLGALGVDVLRLIRIAVGPIRLTGLPPGRYRYLTEPETERLVRCESRRKDPASQGPGVRRAGNAFQARGRTPDRSHAKGGAKT